METESRVHINEALKKIERALESLDLSSFDQKRENEKVSLEILKALLSEQFENEDSCYSTYSIR
jgi:hypothetical protein